MAEYIEREAAISGLDELERTSHHNSVLWPDHVEECRETLRSIPAADVRPVVRGHWITEEEAIERGDYSLRGACSVCGRCDWDCTESESFNFCPNCGAVMRETGNEKA